MSIDAAKPDGTENGSDLATYLREARAQINLLWSAVGGSVVSPIQAVNLGVGATSFDLTGLSCAVVVFLTASVASDLESIGKGMDGQIVKIRAGDANVTVVHATAGIVLTGAIDYSMAAGDWLELVNVGGDGDSVDGVWRESSRYVWT